MITGITGQDGSYLTEFLLKKGYQVYGIVRRTSTISRGRLDVLDGLGDLSKLELVYGDLGDASSLAKLIRTIRPDEIYNLGAQSHVRISFDIPEYTSDVVFIGVVRILEAIRESGQAPRFYQASSSEMFGKVVESPQSENTPFYPRSPYAVAKVAAHHMAVNYRESYGMFICSGILFNHESPRRGENFVTRKITRSIAEIVLGRSDKLALGNLDAKRDWGYAGDYVEAMWMMMQQDEPDDYVIATGETHSVRDFLNEAFSYQGLDWKDYVVQDEKYMRPAEVDLLLGDASRAREKLGWIPKVGFRDLVHMMVDHDIAVLKNQAT